MAQVGIGVNRKTTTDTGCTNAHHNQWWKFWSSFPSTTIKSEYFLNMPISSSLMLADWNRRFPGVIYQSQNRAAQLVVEHWVFQGMGIDWMFHRVLKRGGVRVGDDWQQMSGHFHDSAANEGTTNIKQLQIYFAQY